MIRHLLMLIAVVSLLCSCASQRTGVIDTPKTRGLKGWQKPYMVDGRRYDPLPSHAGFVEDGVASWYGADFHGNATSNGETYDMHALTAAHKTLPLGVYVRVINRRNNREVVVRVNDRGPFVRERIIDLSYAAAKRLEITDAGTAPVHIVALGYRSPEEGSGFSNLAPNSYDAGRYAIQLGAFSKRENAERLASRMGRDYGAADIQDAMVGGNRFFRVRVGSYTSLASAEKAAGRFEDVGYPGCFVVATD